ncbi:rCG37650 [Rattus norvegicus]|uniref:RCG37650 n=1 Tax=Rattus norvegicus TaxID=10116 RepID=A6KSM4_RAT|nr:rCG37650 [Rattus norvegicus]
MSPLQSLEADLRMEN